MAMSVVYTTVNGQILRENRGGVVSDFVPDPLGSVVMVQDAAGDAVYRAEYDPYGNIQSETGTNPSSLGYVGTLGYIKDSATSMYVRARYLLNNLGRWLTKDRLWPRRSGYTYANSSPVVRVDPSGLDCYNPVDSACAGLTGPQGACIALLCSGKAAYDFSQMLKDFKSALGKPVIELIDAGGQAIDSEPFGSASECCQTASDATKPPPWWSWLVGWWEKDQSDNQHSLIGLFCKALLDGKGSGGFCRNNTQTEEGCLRCCEIQNSFHGVPDSTNYMCTLGCQLKTYA